MAFLKQIIVTVLVLLVAAAGVAKLWPSTARAVLNAGIDLPGPVRAAIVWVAPEAGKPAPEVAGATKPGRGSGGRGATIVVAGTVTEGETRTQMKAIGSGEAARSVVVYPDNVTGIIENVAVKSGDSVGAGAVLVTLEHSNEQVALDRARIALDAANDKLDRSQRLRRSNAMSTVDVTDALRARDNATLDLRTAEITLNKRQIRAPFAGRVGIVNVEPGTLVGSQTVIATVDDRSRIKILFYTPESYVPELSIGEKVAAVSTAQPGKTYDGQITAIDSRLDEASRTLRTEAMVENSKDELRPGMSFTVALALPGQSYLSVDPLSVVWERNGPIVWKIENGKVKKAPVKIIERTIDRMLVASNAVKVGDKIVVEGLQAVRDGGPVEIQETRTPPKTQELQAEAPVTPLADGSAPVGTAAPEPVAEVPSPTPRPIANGAKESTNARAVSQADGFGIARAQAAELESGSAPRTDAAKAGSAK